VGIAAAAGKAAAERAVAAGEAGAPGGREALVASGAEGAAPAGEAVGEQGRPARLGHP